jgi:desulfoferrodoxin (superoxide reductase-like protein)
MICTFNLSSAFLVPELGFSRRIFSQSSGSTYALLREGCEEEGHPLSVHAQAEEEEDSSRRQSLIAALAVAAGVFSSREEAQAFFGEPPSLYRQAEAIENANYLGDFFHKIYEPNSNGDPAKHFPKVSIDGDGIVTVSADHVMTAEHYIQFIWLKDVKRNEVVVVKNLPPTDPTPPSLKAQCPRGVTLRPYLFCNLHGLWKGDEFTV